MKMLHYTRAAVALLTITIMATIMAANGESVSPESNPYESPDGGYADGESPDGGHADGAVCTHNSGGEQTCRVVAEDDEDDDDEDDDDDDDDIDDAKDFNEDDDIYDDDCRNKNRSCQHWASLKPSECEANPGYMLLNCRRACRVCERHKKYSDVPPSADGSDLGEPQSFDIDEETDDDFDGEILREDILKHIAESRRYMQSQIELGVIDPELLRACRNEEEGCTIWSLSGECEENPEYMKLKCGPACQSCDMLDVRKRCPMDRSVIGPDVWGPGDLNKMFRRLSSEAPYKSKYNVTVLSSPETHDGGPWVLTLDNFITDEEANRLIEMGAVEGYERSTDVGEMNPDGTTEELVSSGRTSTNAWCSYECKEDEVVKIVNHRISSMTQIPELNSEDLQLLRYEVGQKYETHHDYIAFDIDRQPGVRIVTVYLYLNDVEAGGGTNFPDLDITVMPKRGRVLIWPSVRDSDPNKIDDRTDHQALPVEAGIK